MKVTHVVEAATGGVARYLLDWIESSRELDIHQHLVYSEFRVDSLMTSALDLAADTGWQLSVVPMRREIAAKDDIRALRALRRKLNGDAAADVVHLHSSKAGVLGRLALALNRSTRVVYSPHALATDSMLYQAVESGLSMPPFLDAFASITPSEQEQINGSVNRLSRRPTFVVAPAMIHAPTMIAERAVGRDRPRIVGCGRMVAQKDPHDFVRVLATLRSLGVDATGRWIGDGPERESVQQLAVSLGVDPHFEISGWVDNPLDELGAADVFLSTSRFESFGYVTAESMALGIPAVATAVPGTLSLAGKSNENCMTFAVGDTDQAAALIAQTLGSSQDTALRTQRAKQFVSETFNRSEMARAMMAAYRRG